VFFSLTVLDIVPSFDIMEKMKITSLEEMEKAAQALLQYEGRAAASDKGALVLLLSGELGSGKTTFVQALARELGIQERITSPTFVIQKEYATKKSNKLDRPTSLKFERLVHIDAYRLKEFSELKMLGWDEYIKDSRAVVAIEWPELVGITTAHERVLSLTFSHVTEGVRSLLFNGKEMMC